MRNPKQISQDVYLACVFINRRRLDILSKRKLSRIIKNTSKEFNISEKHLRNILNIK